MRQDQSFYGRELCAIWKATPDILLGPGRNKASNHGTPVSDHVARIPHPDRILSDPGTITSLEEINSYLWQYSTMEGTVFHFDWIDSCSRYGFTFSACRSLARTTGEGSLKTWFTDRKPCFTLPGPRGHFAANEEWQLVFVHGIYRMALEVIDIAEGLA